MLLKEQLQEDLHQALSRLNSDWANQPVELSPPSNHHFGDLTTTVALTLAKISQQNPLSIANELKKSIQEDKKNYIKSVEAVAPGFLNLTLTDRAIWQDFCQITNKLDQPPSILAGQKIMVEFSSPNIAKPFNVGHLRSTIIGDCLARLYRYLGANVVTDNHLGDWGTQYGKLAYAVEQWGDWTKIEADPIPELFKLYVQFHAQEKSDPELANQGRLYFKRLEQGDPKVKATWQKLVELSLADFGQLYQQLGVYFDFQLGESFYEDKLAEVIDVCQKSGIAKSSQGALLIFFPNDELPPLMIRKSDGASTYATRDLAGIHYRLNQFGLDKLVIEIGNEQSLYFNQVIRAAELLGWAKAGQVVHVGHGLFLLPTGKMSTRRGETVWLKDLLEELYQKSLEVTGQKSPDLSLAQRQDIARQIAVGALKYNDLSQNRNSTIVFDKEKSLSLEGNSAPYLQYTIARANSVLRLAHERHLDQAMTTVAITDILPPSERQTLVQALHWPDILQEAAQLYLPSHLTTYLFQLAQEYNLFYHSEPILQAEPADRHRRLLLSQGVARLLQTGLNLLGISTPERM